MNASSLDLKSVRGFLAALKLRPNRAWRYRLAFGLMALLLLCGAATFAAFRGVSPFADNPDIVIWLLNIDMIILLLLSVFLVRRVVILWSGRKRGLAGSHLHVRLVYTFSLLAAAPAILMAVVSAFLFHYGVQTWFDDRVQGAIENSSAVAEAYLEDHKQSIAGDVRLMANEIDWWSSSAGRKDGVGLDGLLGRQSFILDLSEAVVFDTEGQVLARSGLTFSLEFETIPTYALRTANEGEIVILTGPTESRVRALVKLREGVNRFLYVGRLIDPQILSYLQATKDATADYADLQSRYSHLQISVVLIFVVVGMLLLLAAVWLGLILARQLVQPISKLVAATDQVRGGDFSARVEGGTKLEEFKQLGQAFNRMTEQIQQQQGELVQANRQLDEKRLLTEAVLKGVPSGVVGLDEAGVIHLANAAAHGLLPSGDGGLEGLRFVDIVPDTAGFLEEARKRPSKVSEFEFHLQRRDMGRRTYMMRIAVENVGERNIGAILTIDDVTDIQKNQKAAAWSDVARRIAHEIKNPLTPIQLAAERLQRKYAGQIKDDPETFKLCTDTIVRHVEDIGRMVGEFSNFARMPEPKMGRGDLGAVIEETMLLQRQAHRSVTYEYVGADSAMELMFDQQQMRQVFNNLLQNATDSILECADCVEKTVGVYAFALDGGRLAVVVSDSGPGFPDAHEPERLLEPYVTNKQHGTGLGLAIVKKILDDHGALLYFDAPDEVQKSSGFKEWGGAMLVLLFDPMQGDNGA